MNILNTLKPSQLKLVKIENLKKDNILFYENDLCNVIGIVLEGEVSIVSYLEDGKEIIYNTLNKDGVFGNNLVFSSEPYYKGNIIINEDSKIAFIQKNDLITILKNNESFMIEYLRIHSNFTKALNDKIEMLSINSAEERLYFHLHKNRNIIKYKSITSLAKELYLERETLSRLLSKLIKEKRIIKKDKNIILR